MNDTQATIDVVVEQLIQKMGDEVDLVFLYGSYLKATTHKYSDIDLSFVPAHETTWYNITVMVADHLFDLYPMRWSLLERMAEFQDISSSVLVESRVIFQRNDEAKSRFDALADRLKAQLLPEARPAMIRRAQEIFQSTAYPFYLLQQAAREEQRLACLQQAQAILRTVLHCLAVCNQALVDTRKIAQVMALPLLPARFAENTHTLTCSTNPAELLFAAENLLSATRALLLAEQRRLPPQETTFAEVFDSAYPELKRDIQAMLLGCEHQNRMEIRGSLVSLYQELSFGIAQVTTGVTYNNFNSLPEYEQNLGKFGFPALLPYLIEDDFDQLHQQCLKFDQALREFLTSHSVQLNAFADLIALKTYLAAE